MVPVLPEPAHASGSTAQHAPSKSPDFWGSDFDRGHTSAHRAERGHPGEVAPVEDALVVDEEADSGDGLGDLHRLQELPHLLVVDDRPSPGCDLWLEPEQVC